MVRYIKTHLQLMKICIRNFFLNNSFLTLEGKKRPKYFFSIFKMKDFQISSGSSKLHKCNCLPPKKGKRIFFSIVIQCYNYQSALGIAEINKINKYRFEIRTGSFQIK